MKMFSKASNNFNLGNINNIYYLTANALKQEVYFQTNKLNR